MRLRRALWILAIPLLAAMVWSVARRGRYTVPFSTYSTAQDGTKAFFTLLHESGRRPARWTEDLGRLPDGAVLVATGDGEPARGLSRFEHAKLEDWIREGGTLIVLGVGDYVPPRLGVDVVERDQALDPKAFGDETLAEEPPISEVPPDWQGDYEPVPSGGGGDDEDDDDRPKAIPVPVASHPLVHGLSDVRLRRPQEIKVQADGWELLLGEAKDPLGVVVSVGQGRIVVLAGASLATNEEIAKGDHAPLLARIVDWTAPAAGAPIFFDEFHLGMGRGRSVVGYLRARGFGPPLFQIVFCVLLLLLRVSIRFGAPLPPPSPPPDDARTYVEGMARIYRRAGDVPASIDRVMQGALSRVAARHGLPPPSGPRALADSLRASGRTGAAEAVEALERRRIDLPPPGRLRPGDLVSFTRDADRILARAEGDREGRTG